MTNNIPRNPLNDEQIWIEGQGTTSFHDLFVKPVFSMCAPDYFDPRADVRESTYGYTDNSFVKEAAFDVDKAHQQFETLKTTLNSLGAHIILSQPKPQLLDQVFKADTGITLAKAEIQPNGVKRLNLITLSSLFYNKARQPEVTHASSDATFMHNMLNEHYGISGNLYMFAPENTHGEGQGDHIYDPYRGVFWCG